MKKRIKLKPWFETTLFVLGSITITLAIISLYMVRLYELGLYGR